MTSVSKACLDCGMPLHFGVANCAHCGAKVGTLFEVSAVPEISDTRKRWKRVPQQMDEHQQIEKAQDRANNSAILGLASFFPLFGLALGVAAIIYSIRALRVLKTYNIEEGKGSSTAGLIIGALGIVAQACMVMYVLKLMSLGKI